MVEFVGKAVDLARLARDADLVPELKAEITLLKEQITKLEAEKAAVVKELAEEREHPRKTCPCNENGEMVLKPGEHILGYDTYRFWSCRKCGVKEKHITFTDHDARLNDQRVAAWFD